MRQDAERERQGTLAALHVLLTSTEQLSTDVDSHNIEIQQVSQSVGDLQLDGELADLQGSLLRQIASVVESNRRLEDDLVMARHQMEQQAQEIDRTRLEARTDPLSGVANRRRSTSSCISCSPRSSGSISRSCCCWPTSITSNGSTTRTGMPRGTASSTHVGQFLRQFVRGRDYVARFGGDEFVILLAQCDGVMGVPIAERIRAGISRKTFDVGHNGERLAITFSMGCAVAQDGDTAEALLQRADKALYRSKLGGRNEVNWLEEMAISEPAETEASALPDEASVA